jgi:hypothetical protein
MMQLEISFGGEIIGRVPKGVVIYDAKHDCNAKIIDNDTLFPQNRINVMMKLTEAVTERTRTIMAIDERTIYFVKTNKHLTPFDRFISRVISWENVTGFVSNDFVDDDEINRFEVGDKIDLIIS